MTSVSPGLNLSEARAMSAAEQTRCSPAVSVKAATPHPSQATEGIRCIKFRATGKDDETRRVPRVLCVSAVFALTAGRPNVKHWRHHVSECPKQDSASSLSGQASTQKTRLPRRSQTKAGNK